MTGIVVGKVGQIPVGGRKIIVPFRGRAGIGIFNVNGSFYALRNICPHKRGPLCMGEVAGRGQSVAPPSAPRVLLAMNAMAKSSAAPGMPGHSISRLAHAWSIRTCA